MYHISKTLCDTCDGQGNIPLTVKGTPDMVHLSQLSHVVTIVTYCNNCHISSQWSHVFTMVKLNFHLSSSSSSPRGHVDLTAPSSPTVKIPHSNVAQVHHHVHHEQVETGTENHPAALASHGEYNLIQILIYSTCIQQYRA